MAKIIITEFEFSKLKLGQNSSCHSRSYPKQSFGLVEAPSIRI